jgi:hypothetical protein
MKKLKLVTCMVTETRSICSQLIIYQNDFDMSNRIVLVKLKSSDYINMGSLRLF